VDAWSILATVVGLVAAMLLLWRRIRARPGSGRGDSLGPFLRHFDERGIPTDVSLAIFHHLQRWMSDSQRGFPVRPGDDLVIYGISAEDVDDTLALLLSECGRHPAAAPRPPIASVDDLVLHVADCPVDDGNKRNG
jgi:hypothetical protein